MSQLYPSKDDNVPIPPGDTLRELLRERNLTTAQFALDTQFDRDYLWALMYGHQDVTPEVAEHLEIHLGTPARLWMKMQGDYDRKKKAFRKEYLGKLNTVVNLACIILGGLTQGAQSGAPVGWAREELVALERITNLKQVAKVEMVGWEVGDHGNYGGLETVGYALVRVAEVYQGRSGVSVEEMREVDEHIDELRALVGSKS